MNNIINKVSIDDTLFKVSSIDTLNKVSSIDTLNKVSSIDTLNKGSIVHSESLMVLHIQTVARHRYILYSRYIL